MGFIHLITSSISISSIFNFSFEKGFTWVSTTLKHVRGMFKFCMCINSLNSKDGDAVAATCGCFVVDIFDDEDVAGSDVTGFDVGETAAIVPQKNWNKKKMHLIFKN